MKADRFEGIVARYARLRVAVVGDICLDRYLEIDPARAEVSIETGLEVHNVVRVRSQPGAAGTIINNLVALGVAEILPVGFCGEDGEGFELRRALGGLPGVKLDHFLQTPERRTFTYCKPLVVEAGKAPRELNRLDSKNWSPTPECVSASLAARVEEVAGCCDAMILMDQVDVAETGVVTRRVLEAVRGVAAQRPGLLVIADSRRSLRGYPPVCLKMNAAELALLTGGAVASVEEVQRAASSLALAQQRPVFVTLAERGMVGATASGEVGHMAALPVRGEIDIVGAGDSVTANLTTALAGGAAMIEALELAMGAASVVIHQLGTTGTATVAQVRAVLRS